MIRPKILVAVAALVVLACKPSPDELSPGKEQCAACGMEISKTKFAAQLVAHGQGTLFFDDISCLAAYLDDPQHYAANSVAYVADHRTGEWVPASKAIYARAGGVTTPMGSALVAYADEGSRSKDPEASAGTLLTLNQVFPRMPPGK